MFLLYILNCLQKISSKYLIWAILLHQNRFEPLKTCCFLSFFRWMKMASKLKLNSWMSQLRVFPNICQLVYRQVTLMATFSRWPVVFSRQIKYQKCRSYHSVSIFSFYRITSLIFYKRYFVFWSTQILFFLFSNQFQTYKTLNSLTYGCEMIDFVSVFFFISTCPTITDTERAPHHIGWVVSVFFLCSVVFAAKTLHTLCIGNIPVTV